MAKKEYQIHGKAYDVIEGAVKFNDVVAQGISAGKLSESIKKIRSTSSNAITKTAHSISHIGGAGLGERSFTSSEFFRSQSQGSYKDLYASQLISKGIDEKAAKEFVKGLKITLPSSTSDASNAVSIGRTKLLSSNADEHFQILLERSQQTKASDVFSASLLERQARTGTSPTDFLKQVTENSNRIFNSREFQRATKNKINQQFEKFYKDDLSDIAAAIIKPRKESFQNFSGPLSSAKKEFLQRKSAEVAGINLKKDGVARTTEDISDQLRKVGFNPYDFGRLRSYLVEHKKITSGIFEGRSNLFGLTPVSIDQAISRGKFSHLDQNNQRIIKDVAARVAINDPISKSIGQSKVSGMFQSSSGKIIDFNPIKSSISGAGKFLADEFHVPIVKLNLADLFGYQSLSQMSRRGPIQFIPGNTVQPFRGLEGKSDFNILYRSGGITGTKGKVLSYTQNEAGESVSTLLAGSYRAVPTASTEMLSRTARKASGLGDDSRSFDLDNSTSGSRFLDRILGGPENATRFKKRFSFDPEQPNSLFGAVSRFTQRDRDLNNPRVMSEILSGQKVNFRQRGARKTYSLNFGDDLFSVVDETGATVRAIGDNDIIRAAEYFAKSNSQKAMAPKVMQALEPLDNGRNIFTFGGRKVTDIKTTQDAHDMFSSFENALPALKAQMREGGKDPAQIEKAFSKLRKLIADSDLLASSALAKRSPTINSRLDEFKNEAFRFINQQGALIGGDTIENQLFIQIQQIIRSMSKTLPANQLAESQLAALSTLSNLSAFSTFKQNLSATQNARENLKKFLSFSSAGSQSSIQAQVGSSRGEKVGEAVRDLMTPHLKGTSSLISTNIPRSLGGILGPIKSKLGFSPHIANDMSVDPLGSGQRTTLVPTFGTVFGADPFGAIKSAIGLTTYNNPKNYSGAGVPMDHIVGRLNKYFGTLGMQLDSTQFKGPLDLYARGMVGKRVLPIYAAGTGVLAVDRTIGGFVNEEGPEGERVYSPYFTTKAGKGVVELQALSAGLIPGGMTQDEKREQLEEGEVPIRQGRYWPLGNTPFQGGKIQYYRPSWYRKLQGGALFTSQTYGSPMEKFLYYNDISPLRPLDPYKFEDKHFEDRPYPVTGEYFSGPFGPIVPLANATLGKILKPTKMMHEQEVRSGLSNYVPAGQFGAYDASAYAGGQLSYPSGQQANPETSNVIPLRTSSQPISGGYGISSANASYRSAGATTLGTGTNISRGMTSGLNRSLVDSSYGPPRQSGIMQPKIVPSGEPISSGSIQYQTSELGYRLQEMAGIYGFGFGSLREKFGFGNSDFSPQQSVLQSASKAYGSGRAFWDLNLGGLGDLPAGNIELSEITRRFIPKERKDVDYLNPIRNTMQEKYPFLPGSEYLINFQTGDPFTKVQEGEIRLPGIGYERFNRLYSDQSGSYGAVSRLDILSDIAPYSQQFKQVNREVDSMNLAPDERIKVSEIRSQLAAKSGKYSFTEYKQDEDYMGGPLGGIQRAGEYLAHRDTIFNTKFLNKRTATEDWERRNVYGTTFPEWQRPFESFISPMINKATQRDPITAASAMGFAFSLFGRTPRAKFLAANLGIVTGATTSSLSNISESITGDRFIPKNRKKELALEEYTDILSYVKNTRQADMAKKVGDGMAASQFEQAAKRTMYGADIYGASLDTLSLSIPKRKREHFSQMINAPEEERERILSTAGRLERRIFQAAWNRPVEEKPDLVEYFKRHELPDASWEGWHPNTNMDHIKIKVGQQMGLEMSQMGYYPQQIKEANLANPSYPDFGPRSDSQDTLYRLRQLMSRSGMSGSVNPVMNTFGQNQMSISAGVA